MKFYMFHSQAAAAHSVRLLIAILLVAGPGDGDDEGGHVGDDDIKSPERELVYEVECDGSLSDPHLLALHIRHVVLPNLLNLALQLPSLLVLLPVLLPLQPGARVQHDIFYLTLDVLRPGRQPCHRVVVLDFLPLVAIGRLWDFAVLAAVDYHVLRHDPPLDHTLLWVLASTSEQRGRLSSERSNG